MLGLVGGTAAIVWGTLNLIFGGYETHKYFNSLISNAYATSPFVDELSSDEDNEDGGDPDGGSNVKTEKEA